MRSISAAAHVSRAICFLLAPLLLAMVAWGEPRFYPDDPLLKDDDRLDTPKEPAQIKLSDIYDRVSHTVHDPGDKSFCEAMNVNTLDQAPNSTWFTNRHGQRAMTVEELVRGPNITDGPDMTAELTIVASKTEGVQPGFTIEDQRGDRYVIKFDPYDYPELNSAAEVIGTKLMYAIGYNVPENSIIEIDPDQLGIKEGTTFTDKYGDEMPMTKKILKRMLNRVERLPNARIRAIASKFVPGKPLGPFRYNGTRADDPNDVILHENRRELRGLRVFSAWINHDDARAQNTLDTWIEEDGRHYVQHYLLDFGSCLGAGRLDLLIPNTGFDYWFEPSNIGKQLVGLGFVVPRYRQVDWPKLDPACGRFEADAFDPAGWVTDYPNPAFVRATDRDMFWAAAIVMRFTDEELRAIVHTGQFRDPNSEATLFDTLRKRQMKVGREFIQRVNPLDEFQVEGNMVRFVNLADKYAFTTTPSTYRVSWSRYDNVSNTVTALASIASYSGPAAGGAVDYVDPEMLQEAAAPIPAHTLGPEEYLQCEIATVNAEHPAWEQPIVVILRDKARKLEVVGIQRGPDATPR